jgi:hypothetical protein
MGVYGGPDISESGLVLALDGGNYKSFKGEATTNLIPSPTLNAYPTTGNGWGSYNTNQYGSGTYFSIGTVSDVTNNIVTMTSAHSLRTYDVMRPQTTGGGVIADTDYFIKKVSDTSFTLHAYNSSEDGSQGYINPSTGTHKVYDSIANDTRISVNSTSFPTMWWGAPHLPNSGLVKELRYGEFNAIPNLPANDCIRLHYIRTDGVMDGMSYGVDCSVTPGSPVTVSFYTRAATESAVGKQIQYQIYNYSGGSPTVYYYTFALGALGVWERQTFTFTPANSVMISYWFAASVGVYAWDWSCMQVEQKSYATSFIAGTRGDTVATGGGWADLSGNSNHGQLINGPTYSSANGGSIVFDGVDDQVWNGVGNNYPYPYHTLDVWVKSSSLSPTMNGGGGLIAFDYGRVLMINAQGGIHYVVSDGSNVLVFSNINENLIFNNTWHNVVALRGLSTYQVYVDGVLKDSGSNGGNPGWNGLNVWSAMSSRIGDNPNDNRYKLLGNIAAVKVYNRALSAAEIQQNFTALRGRFGL